MLKALPATLLLLLLSVVTLQAAEVHGRVSWVYDGDTLEVTGVGRVRLLGIDTPEYEAGPRDRFYRNNFAIRPELLRRIARQATERMIVLAKGEDVRLESDGTLRDRHGRLLAYVYLSDGRLLNRLLLEEGLATVFRRYDFRRKDEFLTVENDARGKELGLWRQQSH